MRPFEKEMQRRASSSGSDSNLGLAESFFDETLSKYVRTRDAEIALGRSERYSAGDLQHRAIGEPRAEFGEQPKSSGHIGKKVVRS